jgi:cell cycle serine/threonine-protein kinase CDC5/MSD2
MDMVKRRKHLTHGEARVFATQIIGATAYMHNKGIIHRDLKLGNIFIDSNMMLKIGDFGLAAQLGVNGIQRRKTVCGTPNYIAPEVLYGKATGHSYEVDVWAIGVILYAMIHGKPPFQSRNVETIYQRIKYNDYVFPDESGFSSESEKLIEDLLQSDPTKRPKPLDILKYDYFLHDFPESVPETALVDTPNFPTISQHDSQRNFVACQIAAGIPQHRTARFSPIEIPKDEPPSEPNAVLPSSLSPASTKEKYKMVMLPKQAKRAPAGLNLKQRQQHAEKNLHVAISGSDGAYPRFASTDMKQIYFNAGINADEVMTFIDYALRSSRKSRFRVQHSPALYIAKWVDFSDKYGLAYELTDGVVGAQFCDGVCMHMLNDDFRMFERSPVDASQWTCKAVETHTSDTKDASRVKLMRQFAEYMKKHLRSAGKTADMPRATCLPTNACWVVSHARTSHFNVFSTSMGTFQFNFMDHIKLVFTQHGKQLDVIAPSGEYRWDTEKAVSQATAVGILDMPDKLRQCYDYLLTLL